MSARLRIFRFFWGLVACVPSCSPTVASMAEKFPKTLITLRKLAGLTQSAFIKFVVCPKCHSIYPREACSRMSNNKEVSKLCSYIAFPDHPHPSRRKECGTPLLKKVRLQKSGTHKLIPFMSYAYQPLQTAIQNFLSRPGFLSACNLWQKRTFNDSTSLGDIYDGRIWREFTGRDGAQFASVPGHVLLTLNVDWFQPFKHAKDSVGAIYLAIQNLPRECRYKVENIILVGIIPGPKEPQGTVNSFLGPLVKELQIFWQGLHISDHTGNKVLIRAALTCTTCDIPATRKVCGFLGHAAGLGCSKCLKQFHFIDDKMVYSGFDRNNWKSRTNSQHRESCNQLAQATSKTSLYQLEVKLGVRYSSLLELPYFDPVRHHVVDPMHNLFLGTPKHILHVWIDTGILTTKDLQVLEAKAENIKCPADVGRLPSKIGSGFSGFTALQWRYWTVTYSPVILKGIIPNEHLQCWLLYVRACSILSCRLIKQSDVNIADQYLQMFCKKFELLYGSKFCTPNMHLHLHLRECLLDYGPSPSFWCFSFEWYNGCLSSIQTNNRSVEQQFMQRFLREQRIRTYPFPNNPEWKELLDTFNLDTNRSLESVSLPSYPVELATNAIPCGSFSITGIEKLLPPLHERVLSSTDVNHLQSLYQQLYPRKTIQHMSHFYTYCTKITPGDQLISSCASRNERSAVILAHWPTRGDSVTGVNNGTLSVGEIQHFLLHRIVFNNDVAEKHLFCSVRWHQHHPKFNWFGCSAVVAATAFDIGGTCSFLPVPRIAYRCAYGVLSVDFDNELEENVLIACPLML